MNFITALTFLFTIRVFHIVTETTGLSNNTTISSMTTNTTSSAVMRKNTTTSSVLTTNNKTNSLTRTEKETEETNCANITEITLLNFRKYVLPPLDAKIRNGDSGKIGVIGGSIEFTGVAFFTAMAALKVGADLVYVITTEDAAPIIKSYSPDLIVYPYLHRKYKSQIRTLISKTDVIVIGPGLSRLPRTMNFIYEIFQICRDLSKPLVVDGEGLYAIHKRIVLIKQYPSPGAILTPNHFERYKLSEAFQRERRDINEDDKGIGILEKGETDKYSSLSPHIQWNITGGISGRRVAGQGSILAGVLGTFFNWALKVKLCANNLTDAQSLASYAAATLIRDCNLRTFHKYGRSMTASNMINEIHHSFESIISAD